MVATISSTEDKATVFVTGSLSINPWELPPATLAEIIEKAKQLLSINFFHDRLKSIRQILEDNEKGEGIKCRATSDEVIFAGLPKGVRHNMTFLRCAWIVSRPSWPMWPSPLTPVCARTIVLSRQLNFYVLDITWERHGTFPSYTTDQWYEAKKVTLIPADLSEQFRLFTETYVQKRMAMEDHPAVQILWTFHDAQSDASTDLLNKQRLSEQRERSLGGYLRKFGVSAFRDYV
ncbi:hypothetical protein A3D62_02565 [Candidatus Kaiserbacteria bacterium RIFCSPHIGHO2_02_FULL_49_11]|uniref:Uncharacterized protein n=1 Tax=Candidatus Kaiserbacteria bacterium RIFCSPHIGHO2_02_FULL_49_11 TaxID=1798489 RepID=A0A1F6D149_9BACT|nr:MAG: hypothetical protein A3D62_02565 [Candidatus Kaiserbacteria bacterium RIFCSPHIGHO2_02_FULL_49_11]